MIWSQAKTPTIWGLFQQASKTGYRKRRQGTDNLTSDFWLLNFCFVTAPLENSSLFGLACSPQVHRMAKPSGIGFAPFETSNGACPEQKTVCCDLILPPSFPTPAGLRRTSESSI